MNRLLMGICVFLLASLTSGSAQAQADFKGFYIGANGGTNLGRAQLDTTPSFSPTGYFAQTSTPAISAASNQNVDATRYTFGGQAGYNFQWDNFVVGVEADFERTPLSGSTTVTQVYPCCSPTTFTVNQTVESNWLFTARPRMGVVFGKLLAYGTVGYAATSVKYSALFTDTFATAHENAAFDQNKSGWVVGGGGEFQLSRHLFLRGEYLYAGFGAVTTSTNLTAFTPPIAFPSNVFTHTVDLRAQLARGGVNFRF